MYQVLYRKWRPKSFSDVVGQGHITATLKNEIMNGKVSHAYLFTGSRGTGKTTCAKIFAKAVNCLNPKDGEPCNQCEICRGIDEGTVLDVEEIDAASNNGVDNIREIRDEVNFTPAQSKYRVYIIDEVHMLSSGAFNALLKTLEEPPAHVIFILATTEVHKLPATILSRCQRFDFRRIPSEDIAGRLKFVAKKEGIELEEEAALLIARLADGGMRDALSLLDRCNTGEPVTAQRAAGILGLASKENLFELSKALSFNDLSCCLKIVGQLNESASDISRVTEQIITHFRNIMIAKSVKNPAELIVCQKEELVRYMNAGEGFSMGRILEILEFFQRTAEKMRTASSKRVELEMAFVSLCFEGKSAGELKKDLISEAPVKETPSQKAPSSAAEQGDTTPVFTEEHEGQNDALLSAEEAAEKYRSPIEDVPEKHFSLSEDAPPWDEEEIPGSAPNDEGPFEQNLAEKNSEDMPSFEPLPAKEPEREAPKGGGSIESGRTDTSHSAEKTERQQKDSKGSDGALRFDKWPEVLVALSEINRMMSATLRGSSAYIKGENLLLIKSENPMFFELIRKETKNKNDIRSALLKVTGKQFRLGPYAAGKVKQSDDPMKAFLDEMKSKGVNIVEKQ